MRGNKKLCWLFSGKCTSAWYEFLTTKKPPHRKIRGLFVWLIIQQLGCRLLVLAEQLLVAEFFHLVDYKV